jgi:glycosyltransferase involved in cell wall biosynthesis
VKRRLIVVGPLPPPYHGVTVSTTLVVESRELRDRFGLEHLDTSDHRTAANTGRWDPQNVFLALRSVARLVWRLRGERGVVYLPLSQATAALVRDCLFIQAAALGGWGVAAHLRGSEFKEVYAAQRAPMRWLLRSSLRRADVGVLGASLRHVFEGLVAPDRLAVVPNGTPDPGLDGAQRDPRAGLFLSNLRRRKGVVEALEAALIVLREHPDARFDFVGEWEEGGLEDELRGRARAAGGRIRFLPPLTGDAHRGALAAAGFLLFPPVEPEGHPRVVLEAIAAGIPVVTTNRGAIAETVVDGESGFVLDEPVPEELAERVGRLLEEPELRERMGRAARARYDAHFTQEAADRRLAEWIESVGSRD